MITQTQEKPLCILYVTYVSPWKPRYGGSLRCYGILKSLAESNELHVALAGARTGMVSVFMQHPDIVHATRYALEPDPSFEVEDYRASRSLRVLVGHSKYREALRQLERTVQPDIVWYFEAESFRRAGPPEHTPFVLDHCDVRWRKFLRYARYEQGYQRYLYWLKAGVTRTEEILLTMRAELALVASEEEVPLLQPAGPVQCIPNGFDFPDVLPGEPTDSRRFIFFGSLNYPPNADGVRWMCAEIWPIVIRQIPDARLDIVGLGHEALEIVPPSGVTFHGFVDDLEDLIEEAVALVVPLRIGGGTRVKILEAWANGLPVISTSIGVEGLQGEIGKTHLVGDTAEEFAAQCKKCLEDAKLRSWLVKNAYLHGRYRFDWRAISSEINELISNLLAS